MRGEPGPGAEEPKRRGGRPGAPGPALRNRRPTYCCVKLTVDGTAFRCVAGSGGEPPTFLANGGHKTGQKARLKSAAVGAERSVKQRTKKAAAAQADAAVEVRALTRECNTSPSVRVHSFFCAVWL